MELKSTSGWKYLKLNGFNRTFMELKSNTLKLSRNKVCFNRTFMELKFPQAVTDSPSFWF